MRVKFKQAVRLPPDAKGVDYPRGTHDIPEAAYAHPFFQKLLKAGLVEDGEASRGAPHESFLEGQKRLADKIASLPKKASALPSQVPGAPSSDPVKAGPEEGLGSLGKDAAQSLADSTAAELAKDTAEEKAKAGQQKHNKQKR